MLIASADKLRRALQAHRESLARDREATAAMAAVIQRHEMEHEIALRSRNRAIQAVNESREALFEELCSLLEGTEE